MGKKIYFQSYNLWTVKMRLIAVLLIIGASANDADTYCPSSACWTYDAAATPKCQMKKTAGQSDCALLTCNHNGMIIKLKNTLFGATKVLADYGENAGSNAGCMVTGTSPYHFKWETNLGNCGISAATRNGDKIEFTKVLQISRDAAVALPGASIYTSSFGGVQVTFKCEFATTVDLTTDITIQTPVDVTGDVTIANGKFDTGLELAFWDSTYANKITAAQTIGSTMYAKVQWSVTSLTDSVGFFLQTCTVEQVDPSNPSGPGLKPVTVIKDTCYADVVKSKKGTLLHDNKYRATFVRFQYNSFSYDTSNDSSQRLKCKVVFCTHTVTPQAGVSFSFNPDSTCDALFKTDQGQCDGVADHASYSWKFYA